VVEQKLDKFAAAAERLPYFVEAEAEPEVVVVFVVEQYMDSDIADKNIVVAVALVVELDNNIVEELVHNIAAAAEADNNIAVEVEAYSIDQLVVELDSSIEDLRHIALVVLLGEEGDFASQNLKGRKRWIF